MAGEGAGVGRSGANPSHLVSASAGEPDAVEAPHTSRSPAAPGAGGKPGLRHFPSQPQTEGVQPSSWDIWMPICSIPRRIREPLIYYLPDSNVPLVPVYVKRGLMD